jgi:hypothetical protein
LFRRATLICLIRYSLSWIRSEADFRRWLAPLATIDWHAHCQGPPPSCEGPAAALSYLARDVGGSVISDSRILADLLQLRFFWRRCTTVIVTLPYDRRAFRHAPQLFGDAAQWLTFTLTTMDVDAMSYCDAPPPDT